MNAQIQNMTISPDDVAISVRHHLTHKERPTVIMSSGFGTSSLDKPLPLALIDVFINRRINWIQYIYPERLPQATSRDLTISSGLNTLRSIHKWLGAQGYKCVALYGNSFGGNISLELAIQETIAFSIVTNPVFDFFNYRLKQLGVDALKQWKKKGSILIEYPLGTEYTSYSFIEEALQQNLFARCLSIQTRTLAFQGEKDDILTTFDIERLEKEVDIFEAHALPNAGHTISDNLSLELITQKVHRFLDVYDL